MADLEPAAARNNVGWPALWKKPSDGAVSDLKVIFRQSDSIGNLILSEQRGYRALSTQRSQRIGGYSVAFFSLLPVLTPAVEQKQPIRSSFLAVQDQSGCLRHRWTVS